MNNCVINSKVRQGVKKQNTDKTEYHQNYKEIIRSLIVDGPVDIQNRFIGAVQVLAEIKAEFDL